MGFRGFNSQSSFTGNRQVNEPREDLRNLANQLNSVPFLNGKLVEDVTFIAGTARSVVHGLGRPPQGWMVLKSTTPGGTASYIPTLIEGDFPDNTSITLTVGGNATLNIWFF